jgi:uncharacterized membrane protein
MDKIAAKLAALGVPALVLIVVMSVSGFAGAAALTFALASLGGPFGMLGGIAVLGILLLISHALTSYGFDALFHAVIAKILEKGTTKEEILSRIADYPISADLKRKLRETVDEYFKAREPKTPASSESTGNV